MLVVILCFFLLTRCKWDSCGFMATAVRRVSLVHGSSGFELSVGEQFCGGPELVVQGCGSVGQKSKIRIFFCPLRIF